MANLKSVIEYFRFIYDANYIGNENGFCKLKESTRCDHTMRPYAEKINGIMQNLSATLEGDAGEYTTQRY
jgi:hypothetical protein